MDNMREFQVEQLAKKMFKAWTTTMYENLVEGKVTSSMLPGPKTWLQTTEETRKFYRKVAGKMLPERTGHKFADKGPWTYGVDIRAGSSPKHFVQSEAMGEGFDDVRLYINGNMNQKQYVDYGYDLAEFLNSAVQMSDNCENCHGEKGGVPGNENVVNGKVLCDHCS